MNATGTALRVLGIPLDKVVGTARTGGTLAAITLLVLALFTLANAAWRGVIERKVDNMGKQWYSKALKSLAHVLGTPLQKLGQH